MNTPDLASSAHELLIEQQGEWPMLKRGYESLASARTRQIELEGFTVTLQYNPGRIASSSAKVEPKSIAKRKCFLCRENLPPEQRGIDFGDYLILANPFPIFPEHFTIAHKQHTPQRIYDNFPAMLDLAKALGSRYTLFYNGPKCGASAPDHLHFQAGTKNFLPIEREYEQLKQPLFEDDARRVYRSAPAQIRNFTGVESSDREAIAETFPALYAAHETTKHGEEPMMNILLNFGADQWRAILFYRARHRPSFYFAEGDKKLLLSRAAVELGGVCTLPIECDFDRISRQQIVQMYTEVCLTPAKFDETCRWLQNNL